MRLKVVRQYSATYRGNNDIVLKVSSLLTDGVLNGLPRVISLVATLVLIKLELVTLPEILKRLFT